MKKHLLLLLFTLSTIIVTAQPGQRGEKVHSLKIAYLSEQLNLSPAVAEKFWPIYNQYEEEMQSLVRERKQKNDTRSVDDILDQEQKALDIKRKYSALFLKVIDNNQLNKLYRAEKEFRQMVLRRAQQREARMEMREERQENRPFRDNMRPSRMSNRADAERAPSTSGQQINRPNR